MALNKIEFHKVTEFDSDSLFWAEEFVSRLDNDLKRVKVYMGVPRWLKEDVHSKLPDKTRNRIWAVLRLLSEDWMNYKS